MKSASIDISMKKVIEGLELCTLNDICAKENCPYYPETDCFVTMHKDAIFMLKAQEPVKPIRTDNEWQCGNCKAPVGWDELQVQGIEEVKENYCSNCGRKVLWDGK